MRFFVLRRFHGNTYCAAKADYDKIIEVHFITKSVFLPPSSFFSVEKLTDDRWHHKTNPVGFVACRVTCFAWPSCDRSTPFVLHAQVLVAKLTRQLWLQCDALSRE